MDYICQFIFDVAGYEDVSDFFQILLRLIEQKLNRCGTGKDMNTRNGIKDSERLVV